MTGAAPPHGRPFTLGLEHMPGLHALPRVERRARERPLVERILVQHLPHRTAPLPLLSWASSGRPRLGAPSGALDVSLSHDEDYCLCVVGPYPQGCDLAPIQVRTREEWTALLGESRRAPFETLLEAGEPTDAAGTRLWAAGEAIQKAVQAPRYFVQGASSREEAVTFDVRVEQRLFQVLTLRVSLTCPPSRVVAVVLSRGHGSG